MSVEAMSWAFYLEGLTASQKVTLLALADYASKGEWACWPSIESIKTRTALSSRTVQRAIHQLEQLGLLTRHSRFVEGRQTTTLYRLKVGCHPVTPGGDNGALPGVTPCHPEPSLKANHQEEPSVPGMPAAPTAPETQPVKVHDIIAAQKSGKGATRSPTALLAGPIAQHLGKGNKGVTASTLAHAWRLAHGEYVNAFLPALTVKDKGMLSAAKTRVGDIILDALVHAMADWPGFLAVAKANGGAYKAPETPRVWFFCKYVEDAVGMLQKAEVAESVIGKPVQSIAKPKQLTNAMGSASLAPNTVSADDIQSVLDELEGTDD